jgi:hypothetical protein
MSKYYKEDKMTKNQEQVTRIIETIRGGVSTNINNINYTNNINNTNYKTTSIIVPSGNNEIEINPLGIPLGIATLSTSSQSEKSRDSINFVGGSELPAAWMNFKWDLFRNGQNKDGTAKLKLNCNIIKQDGTQQRLTANLNSPHDRVWRKVYDRSQQHWSVVSEEMTAWTENFGSELSAFRASKFALPAKSGSVEITAFLKEYPDDYIVRMIYRGQIYDYTMPKSSYERLTVRQIQGNQIATLYIGTSPRAFVDLDQLGI